jgi:hypothetical protein
LGWLPNKADKLFCENLSSSELTSFCQKPYQCAKSNCDIQPGVPLEASHRSELKWWNFTKLAQHSIWIKITVGICHRSAGVAGHGIKNIHRQCVSTAERLDAMAPRMVWGISLVDDTERPDPPARYFCSRTAALPKRSGARSRNNGPLRADATNFRNPSSINAECTGTTPALGIETEPAYEFVCKLTKGHGIRPCADVDHDGWSRATGWVVMDGDATDPRGQWASSIWRGRAEAHAVHAAVGLAVPGRGTWYPQATRARSE